MPLVKLLKSWNCSVVGDGSLPSSGFEINTHPASGDYFLAQIEDIGKGLKAAKAWVDHRAGCHTHIDAQDLGYLGIARAMRLIACLEPAFFLMIPPARRVSNYCNFYTPRYLEAIHAADAAVQSLPPESRQRIVQYRNAITRTLYGNTSLSSVSDARTSKGGGNRYRAVNLHSWFFRGTLEFRMPPGTVYESNIINWGLLLANILDIAAKGTTESILELTSDIETKYRAMNAYQRKWPELPPVIAEKSIELLKSVAPNNVVKDWISERVKCMKQPVNVIESY